MAGEIDIPAFRIRQLRALLKRFPEDGVDIEGVLLDYLGETDATLDNALNLNDRLYAHFFEEDDGASGKRILRSWVRSDQHDDIERLVQSCAPRYPLLAAALGSLKKEHQVSGASRALGLRDLRACLGYDPKAVIWQLSDLHFGKLNKLETDPRQLAYLVGKLGGEYPGLAPSLVVVSGDVSSVASKKELKEFSTFCQQLSTVLWNAPHPERILVVPGNHDVTWRQNGTSDRMRRFQEIVGEAGCCCITPFGEPRQSWDGGNVVVSRPPVEDAQVPPLALVEYKQLDIAFVLLISTYYSGVVPKDVRKLLRKSGSVDDALLALLRVDEGAIDRAYLFHLASALEAWGTTCATKIGVIHHNPIQYGAETCLNRLAPQLLETLRKKGVPLLLHGHTHLTEDRSAKRAADNLQSFPIPCPTLCSVPSSGSGRGLNVFTLGEAGGATRLDGILWTLSASQTFNEDGAQIRYRLRFDKGGLEVLGEAF